MGKRLIIKGADFSENGIYAPVVEWLNDMVVQTDSSYKYTSANLGTPGGIGILSESLQGVPIKFVRIFLPTAGDGSSYDGVQANIVVAKVGDNIDTTHSALKSFTVGSGNRSSVDGHSCVTIELDSAVTLSAGESLAIEITSDSGKGLVGYNTVQNALPFIRTKSDVRTYYLATGTVETRGLTIQYGKVS